VSFIQMIVPGRVKNSDSSSNTSFVLQPFRTLLSALSLITQTGMTSPSLTRFSSMTLIQLSPL
jgi:hypothetical protein